MRVLTHSRSLAVAMVAMRRPERIESIHARKDAGLGTSKRYADSIDRRAVSTPHVLWHPILDATEIQPGLWSLSVGSIAAPYARVQFIRRGDQLGYRAERADGSLIGHYLNLRSAIFNAWDLTVGPNAPPTR